MHILEKVSYIPILNNDCRNVSAAGVIDFSSSHYEGEPLEFYSIDEALEYYLNFHMESHFNDSVFVEEVLLELKNDIEKYRDLDGVIRISPGCFIYTIKRK